MSLLSETLVEEWLNRNGYFTIRGIKDSIDEIDILGIKNVGNNQWSCVHCEVQVSVRPVSYISKLTKKIQQELKVDSSRSAKSRTDEQLKDCVDAWVENKFTSSKKVEVRKRLFGGNWEFKFVHGNVKESLELKLIESHGIELISFEQIIDELHQKNKLGITGSAAGDLMEIINYYNQKKN